MLLPTLTLAQSSPDILVLGDSQISFGAGEVYLNYFDELPERCRMTRSRKQRLVNLGERQTAAIGVRSTSLNSWTAKSGAAKGSICDIDKTYGVNAGAYGIAGNPDRKFVQIGKGRNYQFCAPNVSPFEAMFADGYYKPKLVVLAFIGNSAKRWSEDFDAARRDAQKTQAQIPKDVPCVFLTTAPVFSKATNNTRMAAQAAISRAFKSTKGHCKVVEGFSRETRAAIEGQAKFFRRNASGRVKDPLHPSKAAIRKFLDINAPALCEAIFSAVK